MTDLKPGNAAFYWTTIFLRKLREFGVKHVVISPGSRSTPLVLAGAANSHFKKHIILDERSAAFTALGIGKATNIPAVLICTSGTALANYYPAVIEARQSGVPMILATADRPPHLRATGANQAIDQLKIFGDYPVFFHEAGEPDLTDEGLNRLKMLAHQSVTLSQKKRGPVHLNFPFRKSLEPNDDFLRKITEENAAVKSSTADQKDRELYHFSDEILGAISEAEKPLIIVGPTAPDDDTSAIARLAEELKAPLLSEATISSSNSINGFAGFLRNKELLKDLEPDLILRFGFQSTAKSLEWGFKRWKPKHHYHFASTHDWQDAGFSGSQHIPWLGRPIHFDKISSSTKSEWLKQWKNAEKDFNDYRDSTISNISTLTDGSVYHYLSSQIPDDHFIVVSNSFPARDIHLFGRYNLKIPLFQNRGVSGIDGVTSTALGISLSKNKPGVLFTGDLAFLHDTNALLNHQRLENPLTIVVINNSGGSIFRMLPIAKHDEYFKPYFETPQSADIGQLVGSYDVPFQQIDSLSSLRDVDLQDWMKQNNGLSVIECKTDPDASMELRKKLWDYQP
jgi:2-succinyl-5-enolpyruvyl-6-hydroxy-3-cyclohexene-1-carboxylate synthase